MGIILYLVSTATLYVHRQSAYLIGRDRRVCGYCTGGILTCLYACGHCTGGGCPSRPPFVLQPACCAAVQTGQLREERRFHWEACQVRSDLHIPFTQPLTAPSHTVSLFVHCTLCNSFCTNLPVYHACTPIHECCVHLHVCILTLIHVHVHVHVHVHCM